MTVKFRWKKGELKSGPFKGPIWGGLAGEKFFMIVPVKATLGKKFELWFDDKVLGDRKTVADAKKFAETWLLGYLGKAA